MEVLAAFAAALVALRLAADLLRRWRRRPAPELLAWSASLAAYAAASGALAWGAAAGWSETPFRVYYLGGGLLTAALLGTGSLLLAGRRWAAPLGLLYTGFALGIALVVPLGGTISGTELPEAQDVLALWPARVVAIAANSLGTLTVVGRRKPAWRAPLRRWRRGPARR